MVQEDLINSNVHKDYDLLVLQEPFIDTYGNAKAMRNWRVVYPSSRQADAALPRAVILVNHALDTNCWSQVCIADTRDLVAIQVKGDFGRILIYDIYNDCNNNDTITRLGTHLASAPQRAQSEGDSYSIWCGDFNRHHPLWDEEWNHHLFTAAALREADKLLMLLADYGMEMALPKGIPTLEAMASKNWTRLDNVFCSDNLGEKVMRCTTDPRLRGPGTDHVPILTTLELSIDRVESVPSYNFWAVEWDKFRTELGIRLGALSEPVQLHSEGEYESAVSGLTRVLQETIQAVVPQSRPSPYSKRWWSKELDVLKKKKNKLSCTSYKYRAMLAHPSHEEHRKIRRKYGSAITKAKQEHWTAFLEGLSYAGVWTANRYILGDASDGGKMCIPTLTLRSND